MGAKSRIEAEPDGPKAWRSSCNFAWSDGSPPPNPPPRAGEGKKRSPHASARIGARHSTQTRVNRLPNTATATSAIATCTNAAGNDQPCARNPISAGPASTPA